MSIMGFDGIVKVNNIHSQYCRDVTVDLTAAEVDDTSRANDGWESSATGLKKFTVSFQMIKEAGDNAYATLKSAFKNNTVIPVDVTDADGDAIVGNAKVSKMTRNEPLNGPVTVDVTLVGQGKPSWE